MEQGNNSTPAVAENNFDIREFLSLCLSRWHWFVLSLAVCGTIACLYILTTRPTYTRTLSVVIKENTKGSSASSSADMLSELGLFSTSTNAQNEMAVFASPATMLEVVKRLNLNMTYHTEGFFRNDVVYGLALPVMAVIDTIIDQPANFTLTLKGDGSVELSDFAGLDAGQEWTEWDDVVVSGNLLDTLVTPVGRIIVQPGACYTEAVEAGGMSLLVSRSTALKTASALNGRLNVELDQERSTVVNITLSDDSPQRAEDVLNTLVAVYNESWINDKNQIAYSTSLFIDGRLKVIEAELGNVDRNISSYKSENLLPDVQAASNIYMQESSARTAELTALNNQLYMTKYVQAYLANSSNKTQLLPVNSGIENNSIESQISEYNTTLLRRNSLVANSSEQNPIVVDLDQQLAAMRAAIISSIENHLVALNSRIAALSESEKQTTQRIAANPQQARELLSEERQQKVKESLYLFLLQKREENELSQAFTAYNTRVITPPMGSSLPSAPNKRNILLAAIAIGLLLPAVIIYLITTMDTKIKSRRDIKGLSVPFAGEVPQARRSMGGRKKKKKEQQRPIVVAKGKSDTLNEAFRIIRTNVEFMVRGEKGVAITFTSMVPGSGKTFTTVNLGTCFAIKGKRVIVVDADLRKASLSYALLNGRGHEGLSTYLAEQSEIKDCIHTTDVEGLDLFAGGPLPPNMTELLASPRLKELIDTLKKDYDYIFVDCTPIDMLADASLVEKTTDRTAFVIRAEVTDRAVIPEIEKKYRENVLKNMFVILNGTSHHRGYGYHYGYGYGRYGYGKYGYGGGITVVRT